MTRGKTAALIIFVLRCTAAVTAVYLLASAIGFPHPLWACIFALVGSQDNMTAIFMTIGGRVAGTIIGVWLPSRWVRLCLNLDSTQLGKLPSPLRFALYSRGVAPKSSHVCGHLR
jgi:uncharacterized membrane protein YccC